MLEDNKSYLNDLNDAQLSAVLKTDGPSMVIAGAGSGKTRVLTYKIVHLVNNGVDPFEILALTFTNKAAREMKLRISSMIGESDSKSIWMGTFHSVFAKILRLLFLKRIDCQVHNASSHKPEKDFIKCFESNPEARWVMGIDGLPKDSHKYRINQDGEKLFRMMLEAKKILKKPPVWQYLVFKYNQKDIPEAKALADKHGLPIMIVQSSRWKGDDDYLKPKEGLNAL